MRIGWRDHDRRVDDREKGVRIGRAATLGDTGRIQAFRILLGHKKLDRHRLQNTKMISPPTPEADEKNSFRLLHVLKLTSKVRHLRAAVVRRNEIFTQAPETFFC